MDSLSPLARLPAARFGTACDMQGATRMTGLVISMSSPCHLLRSQLNTSSLRSEARVNHAANEATQIPRSARDAMRMQCGCNVLQEEMPYLQGCLRKYCTTCSVTLFLTVTLISLRLSGWFQVVCFLHKFSPARVRPRSQRQLHDARTVRVLRLAQMNQVEKHMVQPGISKRATTIRS